MGGSAASRSLCAFFGSPHPEPFPSLSTAGPGATRPGVRCRVFSLSFYTVAPPATSPPLAVTAGQTVKTDRNAGNNEGAAGEDWACWRSWDNATDRQARAFAFQGPVGGLNGKS